MKPDASPFLAGKAIGDNVARELEIVAGVERGLDDMRAGRVVAHEDVMADIDATIEEATRAKAEKRGPD